MFKKYINQGKKLTALVLILTLLMSIVSGCTSNDETDTGNKTDVDVEVTDKDKENKDPEDKRTIKDMAGREIEIPNTINKVFTTSPVGTIALYSIDPTKVAGLNKEISPAEAKYLDPEFQKLPIQENS